MPQLDKVEQAIRRIVNEWPKNPRWIYTTPDNGKHVYRAMRTDVCPEVFKDSYGQPVKQLCTVNGEHVARDEDYGKQEIHKW
jgi:hypothetical protein|tara:strand:+ start:3988 stop:4233 length:246 start_codon:yes stop_codon:yes gene_type:complete